jgi:hypothetical protein
MPNGIAAIGSVLPRENTGVESVPCNRFTISTRVGAACSEAARGASYASPPTTTAAPATVGTPIADPIAANPVALRKVRLLPAVTPAFNSELIFPFDGPAMSMDETVTKEAAAAIRTNSPYQLKEQTQK